MAPSLHWQCATMAAAPIHGGGIPQDRGQVCAGTGSQGWDLQRRGRGLQGRGPFLPLLLSARGRILHCNFKCYNFLITSSKTMSSLCGEGPPPSRLVLHAPLTGSGAFMGKDSSIAGDGPLKGAPHPLNPHGLPRGTAGRDPHPDPSWTALSRPRHTARGWGQAAARPSCFGTSSPCVSPGFTQLRWEGKGGSHASALRRVGGDPGQGAREIWEPPSEERALRKAKPFPLPREQEFFKACNYRSAEREAARGSHAAAPAGSEACAELPACLRAAPGTHSLLQGKPRASRGVFGHSAAANHPTRQESGGSGLAPVRDSCLMAIFLPPLFHFKCEVSPARAPAS